MYEADLGQGGALRLRRRVLFAEDAVKAEREVDSASDRFLWKLRFVLDGRAGAVELAVLFGHHGTAEDLGSPVWAESPGQTFRAYFASGGITLHAFRPLTTDHAMYPEGREDCDVLDGMPAFHHTRDFPSLGISTELVRALGNPGGVEPMWAALEEVYREEFVPALSRVALARVEAERAEQFAAQFAERAEHLGPPLVWIPSAHLHAAADRQGQQERLVDSGQAERLYLSLEAAGLEGIWLDPVRAKDMGWLCVDPDPAAECTDRACPVHGTLTLADAPRGDEEPRNQGVAPIAGD